MSGERPDGSTVADGGRRDDRGQTQIDFAVGAGVFLVTLAFVIAFVPTLFEPFAVADTASPLVSDRIADGTLDLLGASTNVSGEATAVHAPTRPGVLSPACTVAFFAPDAPFANDTGCPFDADTDLAVLFGTDDDVQIVVHDLNETAPTEGADGLDVETRAGTVENVSLHRSTADPGSAVDDVTVSRRIVSLNGAQYRLTVRVW
ncbi:MULTISPECIES: DUF7287 family protein [Haloferacaceae]|uniref:Uncharacterized protein n=1 Tax=Halorubrum glutamatedens TaxID=2707018 RepID=A0ABD5QVN4_9EURY|nr:hypothetical protein [Halobellus captivus]